MPKPIITDERFTEILEDILHEEGANLLAVPGVYEATSEHFNNEIIERFEDEQRRDEDDEEDEDEETTIEGA